MSKGKPFEEFLRRYNNGYAYLFVDNGDNEGIVSPVKVNYVKVYCGDKKNDDHNDSWWLGDTLVVPSAVNMFHGLSTMQHATHPSSDKHPGSSDLVDLKGLLPVTTSLFRFYRNR